MSPLKNTATAYKHYPQYNRSVFLLFTPLNCGQFYGLSTRISIKSAAHEAVNPSSFRLLIATSLICLRAYPHTAVFNKS